MTTHKQEHIIALVPTLCETNMSIDPNHEYRSSIQDLVAIDYKFFNGWSYNGRVLVAR